MKRTSFLAFLILFLFIAPVLLQAQPNIKRQWTADGNHYIAVKGGQVEQIDIREPDASKILLNKEDLTPEGASEPLLPRSVQWHAASNKLLIFTNTARVWRYHTRGDYWVYDFSVKSLRKLGANLSESSLMFAKFSPDGQKVAYVSGHDLYVENLSGGTSRRLTEDGADRMINGTFDWVYEEEFGCRDGFRWSPKGDQIAYWKIDARNIRNYLMLNTTDSTYSYTIPVEYPKAGQDPSRCEIYTVSVETGKTQRMDIPGDAVQHYIPRMEWTPDGNQLIIQQLNRAQNQSKLLLCDALNGTAKPFYEEQDEAWIDIKSRWNNDDPTGWEWLDKGKSFLWVSEKDGWRHLYRVDRDGKEQLLTPGEYDVIAIDFIDESAKLIYFSASPSNATQQYLYKVKLSGGKAQRVTPDSETGTNSYQIAPNGKLAVQELNSTTRYFSGRLVRLPDHKEVLAPTQSREKPESDPRATFFQVTTADGITMDGWMVKPADFDERKKYPIVFYVYGEPAGQTVTDSYNAGFNRLYEGNMAADGYVYVSLENRGAPAPKGRAWRKSIYKNIGILNIRDQAMGAKEVLKWDFVDSSRVAVWGWSGGGSSTLNLLFQYPEIYQTGIAVAAVGNQLMYDNIYQERYMGVPTESKEDFLKGSPITYAKNLEGNLLYIHGTADDNVHYQNAELLINELVKHNRQFQLMSYPNRSHSISEGEGTSQHLSRLFTEYLRQHCPPGGR